MLKFAREWLRRSDADVTREFSFARPLVLLQSDDWGRVGVRDREGYEILRASGIRLGEHPYDFYTFETAEDLAALRDLLKKHRDSSGRSACIVMNFLTANLDFQKMAENNYKQVVLLPLSQGLPANWQRPHLFEAYRQGIAEGIFYPALHGLTHFCSRAVEYALSQNSERAELLREFWAAGTPYIYWRMPWVGYEYHNPEKPNIGFLSAATQEDLIRKAAAWFEGFFKIPPFSACAPGYRANHDTQSAWAKCGVRVAQNGAGAPQPPSMGENEVLNLYRTIDFEPSQRDLPIAKYMQLADDCFNHGMPAIISVHSINFHSSLKDYRTITLESLDQFLSTLEAKYPNLLYVHDGDVYDLVTRGKFRTEHGRVSVEVKQKPEGLRRAARGATQT